MINLVKTEFGIQLPVKAVAEARRNAITGTHGGSRMVAVTAPEKGKATKAIGKIIASELGAQEFSS